MVSRSAAGMAKDVDPLVGLANDLAANHAENKRTGKLDVEAPMPENAANREATMEAANATLEALAEAREMNVDTLVGDMTSALIEQFRHRKEQWAHMSAGEQRDLVKTVENSVKLFARKAVVEIAKQDRPSIRAVVKKMADDGAKQILTLELVAPSMSQLMDAHKVMRKECLIVLADAQDLMAKANAEDLVEPDQAGLAFEAETGNEDDED